MDPNTPQPLDQSAPQVVPNNNTMFTPTSVPGAPTPQSTLPTMPTPPPPAGAVIGGPKAGKSKMMMIVVIAVVLLVVILGAVLMLGKKPAKKAATKTPANTSQSQGPQPAKALDVEQSNNSINQDITGLNDDKDYPADQLSDKSLNL